jgi:flagellar biosynthesis regulator FlbT
VAAIYINTLRHSYTTLLRQNNNNPKVVQRPLRHASYSITMNVYDEAMSEETRNAHRGVIQQLNRSVTRRAPKAAIPQVVEKVGGPISDHFEHLEAMMAEATPLYELCASVLEA